MKTCGRCGEQKPADAFDPGNIRIRPMCTACEREIARSRKPNIAPAWDTRIAPMLAYVLDQMYPLSLR